MGILTQVANALATPAPPYLGDEFLKISVENWPDGKGGTVDATSTWDGCCASYNFPTVAAASLQGTFQSEYTGSDFDGDFR